MPENTSIEKSTGYRLSSLLADALEKARDSQGYWLNKAGRQQPAFYKKNVSVNAFNALMMGLHADKTESKTAQYVLFSEAKNNGYSVRQKQNGVPFNWARFENYVHRHKPDNVITRDEYMKLSPEDKELYKAHPSKETRIIFNIDQTILPSTQKQEYERTVKEQGGIADRPQTEDADKKLRMDVNQYILNLRDNLCQIRKTGDDITFYDQEKDTVNIAPQDMYGTYDDYVQDVMRSTISATGHPQRLGREAFIQGADLIVNPDAEKQEKLVEEIASAVKMQELGLPAKISKENMGLIDYWVRELKENPNLINALESDVNAAVSMVNKANRGEKVELAADRVKKQTEQYRHIPLHYAIAEKLRQMPNKDEKIMVIVLNATRKNADVILPAGASTEVNNEIPGMSKKRIEAALKKQGVETVNFYNPDGALGYRHDDSFYEGRSISTQRLNNWDLEQLSTLDVSEAVKNATREDAVIDNVQLSKEKDGKWIMYIKPEGQEGYGVYADANDLKMFFIAVKQKDSANIAAIKTNLANKYHNLATAHPELKVSLAGDVAKDVDALKVEKANIYKDKEGNLKLYVTIEGMEDKKFLPRPITDQQWQRLFIADDKTAYKKNLAAVIFPDLLRGENIEASLDTRQTTKRTTAVDAPIHVTPKMVENWIRNAPSEEQLPKKFDSTLMIKDDDGKWVAFIKPEGEEARIVRPDREDVAIFFETMKGDVANVDEVRGALSRKAYMQYDQKPETRVNLFGTKATEAQMKLIDKAYIFKTPQEEGKESQILCSVTIDGEKQKPRQVSNDQWQRMWLAPDMQAFKKNLAGTLFKDVLEEKEAIINDRESHEEDKECTRLLNDIDSIKKQLKTETDPHKVFDLKEQLKATEAQLNERVAMLQNGGEMPEKDKGIIEIPAWALPYVMNGDDKGLTKEQKADADKFLKERFPDGFVPDIVDDGKEMTKGVPAFGGKGNTPEDVVKVKFSDGGGMEMGTKQDLKGTLSTEDMQKDKECARLIKDIEAMDKKVRAEKMPNRQRAMYLEMKGLQKQLQERVSEIIKDREQQAKQEENGKQKDGKKELSPLLKQFLDLKAKHPDALLLFRTGDFYETYKGDAEKASKILGITLTKSSKTMDDEGKPLAMAGFPYHALDAYLPKLIRAGQRVAICDQIEAPRQTTQRSSGQDNGKSGQQEAEKNAQKEGQEEKQTHGFHR